MSTASAGRILVPVGDSVTVRNTVAYVVRTAAESGTDTDERPEVHFVFPASWQRQDLNAESAEEAEDLLERVRAWVEEDLDVGESERLPVTVSTAVIGGDEYLFGPRDYSGILLDYAREHNLDHIVLDPEYSPGAGAPLRTPLRTELELSGQVTFEEAPVERTVGGRQLFRQGPDLRTFITTFLGAFLFYQVLGGFAGTFDYITGAVTATIAATVLSSVAFERRLRPVHAVWTLLRWLLYVPYLFWEITKANLQVVYIVLHPSMPIDPSIERFSPEVPHGLPVTTLANSITLTPGTVTVDIRDREFHVHALTQTARDGLYDGGLERAVRFVFFGRAAARIATPRERGEAEESTAEAGASATAENASPDEPTATNADESGGDES